MQDDRKQRAQAYDHECQQKRWRFNSNGLVCASILSGPDVLEQDEEIKLISCLSLRDD